MRPSKSDGSIRRPSGVSSRDAAAIALVGITAHLGLFRTAGLHRGEIVFIHGGSGGVGSCVVQMARTIGARVITTAGSDEKVEDCRRLGADLVIPYKTDDVDAAIRHFAPSGVNLWWETLREPDIERAVGHLTMRGRMILMAGRDARPLFPVGPFYTKDCTLHGFAMFNASAEEQQHAAEEINRWLAEGKAPAQDLPRHAAGRNRRRPSAPRRQHDPQDRRPGRQDRAGTVTQDKEPQIRESLCIHPRLSAVSLSGYGYAQNTNRSFLSRSSV